MQGIIEKIEKWLHWIVFLVLEVASLVLLFRFNSYHGSVWFTQANAVVGKVLQWEADVINYTRLTEVNRQLMRENLILQYNMDVMRHHLADLERDSSITEKLMSDQMVGMKLIPARVVNNSVQKRDNLLTIDRGSNDGVRTEMGVVCGTGVVGIVCMTSPHYSIVLPVLNSKSSISCRVRGTEYFGYMKWKGGSPLRAVMDDVPRHARIKKGDHIETSGFSNVFPAGIFVGKVNRILNSEDGLAYQLEIQLSTDFARLRDVSVVAQDLKSEIDSLQNHVMQEGLQ